MSLHRKLLERAEAGRPVTVGLIGAGKFGTMFLSQARSTAGLHVVAVADLDPGRARAQLKLARWPDARYAAASIDDALQAGTTTVTDDSDALVAHPGIEVVVEATGDPGTGIRFASKAIDHGKHIVMVNVEADALAGPLLARRARAAGTVYSLAWGDQPALIADHVDWARTAGFTRRRGRQGHALPAGLPPVNAGHRLGHPRHLHQDPRPRLDQPKNVQLLYRRHQIRHRDDGGVQRDRPGESGGRPLLPAGVPLRARASLQAPRRRRGAGEGGA